MFGADWGLGFTCFRVRVLQSFGKPRPKSPSRIWSEEGCGDSKLSESNPLCEHSVCISLHAMRLGAFVLTGSVPRSAESP